MVLCPRPPSSNLHSPISKLFSLSPPNASKSAVQVMDVEVDHYAILGLPSGEEGVKLSGKDITKAYRLKALELHPDKRLGDPNADANFQRLKTSYEILKDEKARKLFDDLLRIKRDKLQRQSQQDSKRRKMMSDLEERERAAFAPDANTKAREEEERIARKLREEIARIRAMHANKAAPAMPASKKESMDGSGSGPDKEKVLKVSWEKVGEDYSAQRLRELFGKFGEVEDVVIKSSKKRGSALVVMASKDGAVAATGSVSGDLSNPLLVLPLQPVVTIVFPSAQKSDEPDGPKLTKLVGAGYQAFEDSVLKKLQKEESRRRDMLHPPTQPDSSTSYPSPAISSFAHSGRDKVRVADGSFSSISGAGDGENNWQW